MNSNIQIIPVLCNEKNMANYSYILHNKKNNLTIIIDAAEANPIIKKLSELNLTPSYILTTHHHFDHVEGNLPLKEKYNLKIIAPEKEFSLVPGADISVNEQTTLDLEGFDFQIIQAGGHTNGHILYYLKNNKALFTGDILFNLCVGGLFEGSSRELFQSLEKISLLPNDTLIFPGHEYTRSCLPRNITKSDEFNIYLQKMIDRENLKLAPATLLEEKMFNPYLQFSKINDFME
jgi:hydroxyacylglutathione hydrolase